MEYFTNQQDIKTKTINWCDKLHKSGLLTPDQFNQCITTFNDASAGLLPKDFKTPQTGLNRNYSLYNTQQHELTSKINTDNTGDSDSDNISNDIMLSTYDGLTLACKNDNTMYLVSNINDATVKQNELYFTLVPQNTNTNTNTAVYALLSPYGKYLIVNTDYGASFTGISVGPMASWNIIKIDTSKTSNTNNIMFESAYYSNFHLLYDNDLQSLKIIYGKTDTVIWGMTSKQQLRNSNNNESDNTENENENIKLKYKTTLMELLNNISNKDIHKICITEILNAYNKLTIEINDIFTKNITYISNYLLQQKHTYELSDKNYQFSIKSIRDNIVIDDNIKKNIISSIPLPNGLNISDNNMTLIINNITNAQNSMINNLQKNNILPLQIKLDEITNSTDINFDTNKDTNKYNDFDTYISSLQLDDNTIDNNIKQNNSIIDRQKQTQNKTNNNYINHITKKKQLDSIDNITSINAELINNFNTQNKYKKHIYMVISFILILIIIYISNLTITKFRKNILSQN